MQSHQPRAGNKAAIVIVGAICALSASSLGFAQDAAKPAHKKPAAAKGAAHRYPDWRGVWAHDGSLNLDPTTKSGERQPNAPLTPAAPRPTTITWSPA
jgi:hypothetical protein